MLKNNKAIKTSYILQALLVIVVPLMVAGTANSAFLSQRSISVKNPIANAVTDYSISFKLTTPATLGSIRMQFCNSPLFEVTCVAPLGFTINSSTLTAQSGETGFAIDPLSTPNDLLLSRVPSVSLAIPVSYDFTGVTNASTPKTTIYIRIQTYVTNDGTGASTDRGAAAFSTSGRFGAAAYVPPLMYFCVGITVSSNCSSVNGTSADFGDLSINKVSSITSQSAVATNDPTGYILYILGTTMTSGNNVISEITQPNPSLAGNSQFGINMRINNNPQKGLDRTGSGSGTILPSYNTPDLFMFKSGDPIAQASQATEFNVYTTTYITNISPTQPVGVYSTTITYVAVAQF